MNGNKLSLQHKRSLLGIAFIAPWLLGFIFLFAAPLLRSIQFSFSKLTVDPSGFTLQGVGWANFNNALFVDASFNRVLTQSVWDMVLNVPMILFFSLFSATLLNQKFREESSHVPSFSAGYSGLQCHIGSRSLGADQSGR